MTVRAIDRFSLVGKTALIAGASGAIGGGCARVLHEAGAHVVLAGRRMERLAALAQKLGDRTEVIALDVTDATAIDAAPACDVLVNATGVALTRPALEQSAADWDTVINTNLRGPFLLSQAVARGMAARGSGGSIVNIASILAERVIAGVAPYAASKAGLVQITRALALELARFGIRVNALAPGYIETELNAAFFASEAGAALIRRIPQRRLGTIDDLAGPLLLLASDAGAHITGAVLTVDGGHSISSL